jgi:DNA-binding IclR family transcriptional regulator
MQIEVGQFRTGLACASVPVANDRDMERRVVLACAMPAAELLANGRVVRTRLLATARTLAEALATEEIPPA